MSIIDTIKGLIGGVQAGIDGVNKLKTQGQELATEYSESVNDVVDTVQDKLPGTAGDAAVDGVQEKIGSVLPK